MRFVFALAVLGFAMIGVATVGLASSGTASAASQTINVGNFYFCSAANENQVCSTNLVAGDTVTWSVGAGATSHTITECTDESFTNCSGGFNSGAKAAGSTFSQTFNTSGTIYYRCDFHPSQMKGKLVISAAATATATPAPSANASATAAASGTPTGAALPQTGGPADDGASTWLYITLVLGGALVLGSVGTFAVVRARR